MTRKRSPLLAEATGPTRPSRGLAGCRSLRAVSALIQAVSGPGAIDAAGRLVSADQLSERRQSDQASLLLGWPGPHHDPLSQLDDLARLRQEVGHL